MKLNEIDFDKLSNNELIHLCLKYKIIEKKEIPNKTRGEILELIKTYLQKKLKAYGEKKTQTKNVKIQRRLSTSGKIEGIPRIEASDKRVG